MSVRDQVIIDVRDGQAEQGEGLGGPGPAIDEEMVVAFHDEEIVLEEFLGEGAARADERKVEAPRNWRGRGAWRPSAGAADSVLFPAFDALIHTSIPRLD